MCSVIMCYVMDLFLAEILLNLVHYYTVMKFQITKLSSQSFQLLVCAQCTMSCVVLIYF
jgi:hypothetical protein